MAKKAVKKATTKKKLVGVTMSEWNGKPMMILGDPESRFPFQFQKHKAQLILDAIEKNGVEAFKDALRKVIG